ncbi:MAG: CDC27 family protein [Myxococcota bacterium]
MRPLIGLFLTIAALVLPPPGIAFADEDREVATAQFKEARRLYDDEKYRPALKLFELAWQFSKSPNARFYIGKCHLALEQYEDAYNALKGTLRDTATADTKRYEKTRRAAAADLGLLEARVGRLFLVLADEAQGADVTVGGAPWERFGEEIAVPPGEVAIEATAADGRRFARTAEVAAGATTSVAVVFPSPAPGGSGGGPQGDGGTTAANPIDTGPTALETAGYITLGVGGAVAITGGILTALAGGRFEGLEEGCGGARCDDPTGGIADVIDESQTLETTGYVLLGVGGAALLTGGLMALLGGDGEETSRGDAAGERPPRGRTVGIGAMPLIGGGAYTGFYGRF